MLMSSLFRLANRSRRLVRRGRQRGSCSTSGTLTGMGDVSVTGSFAWTGGIMSGAGRGNFEPVYSHCTHRGRPLSTRCRGWL